MHVENDYCYEKNDGGFNERVMEVDNIDSVFE